MQAAAIGTIGTLAGRGTLASSLATLAATIPDAGGASRIQRLSNGWEYLQGSLGGPWEVWRSEEVAVFVPVLETTPQFVPLQPAPVMLQLTF